MHRCPVSGYDAVLKLPLGVDPWQYVTAEVAAISWRGVSAAFPGRGETALVVGQGMIGAFAAKWLMFHDARVIVTDVVGSRLERARRWGVTAAVNAREPDAREQVLAYCDKGVDVAIETSATIAGAKFASSLLRQPAARKLNSAYPSDALPSDARYWPRLVWQATYAVTDELSPSGMTGAEGVLAISPGDRTVGDRLAVIERIRCGDLPVEDIIESPTPVEEAPEAYVNLRDNPEKFSAMSFAWQ
jgi:threonine dehydrogenase-like Zn-dependent dehydrogenase